MMTKHTQTIINVGISELNIVASPNIIRTSGLGSCVAVVLYDLSKKIAGLAHIMLPDSKLSRQKEINQFKYADTAIPILVKRISAIGGEKKSLRAKLSGGAQMFQFFESDVIRIGSRNIEAVESLLKNLSIPIVARDVGGNRGRTIEFDPSTGKMKIRTVHEDVIII